MADRYVSVPMTLTDLNASRWFVSISWASCYLQSTTKYWSQNHDVQLYVVVLCCVVFVVVVCVCVCVCTDKASNIMATDPEQARKRRKASCGISLAGIIITVVTVITVVIVDLKACVYVYKGVCYRFRTVGSCSGNAGVVGEDLMCYSNPFWGQFSTGDVFEVTTTLFTYLPLLAERYLPCLLACDFGAPLSQCEPYLSRLEKAVQTRLN